MFDYLQSVNPYQITLSTGEGFCPARDELQRLEAIDTRLKGLLPPEDFVSIMSSPRNITPAQVNSIQLILGC